MWPRQSALFALAVVSLAGSGCDTNAPRNTREWRASDHAAPATSPSQSAGQTAGGAPQAPSQEMIERAAGALFEQRCASCHGAGGAGDGAEAPPETPDFTVAAFHASKTDEDLARAIRMGSESELMPAFGDQLNERGISALVGHVRRFRPAE